VNDKTNNTESAPDRCRRTDGKKWQCKSVVLPGQKYCATHMHRGAKKRFASHEIAAAAATTTTTTCSAVTIARLPNSPATTNMQKEDSAIPSTNLSMSVPASAQCNGKGSSNNDTDTTISDTLQECSYTSFWDMLFFFLNPASWTSSCCNIWDQLCVKWTKISMKKKFNPVFFIFYHVVFTKW